MEDWRTGVALKWALEPVPFWPTFRWEKIFARNLSSGFKGALEPQQPPLMIIVKYFLDQLHRVFSDNGLEMERLRFEDPCWKDYLPVVRQVSSCQDTFC